MAAPSQNSAKDEEKALGETNTTVQINPEVLKGTPPLPGLDEIEVMVMHPSPFWARLGEGIGIHVVGSGVVAVLAFSAGLIFAGVTNTAEGTPKQPASCMSIPAPAVDYDQYDKPE